MTPRAHALPIQTISDSASSRSRSKSSCGSSPLAQRSVDAALVLGCGSLIWALTSRSLLLEAIAVAACIVAAAAALVRTDQRPIQATASAAACSTLAVTVLISGSRIWAPNDAIAAASILLAAVGLLISSIDNRSPDRRVLLLVVVATIVLGPLWSLWSGDDGLSITTALRLLATVVAVSAAWTARLDWRRPAANLGIAGAAVLGTSWLDWPGPERIAVTAVGLLVLYRWWRVDGWIAAPVSAR